MVQGATLRACLEKHQAAFERDRNLGLAKQGMERLAFRNIHTLTQTYLTLSLEHIAESAELANAAEAEAHICRMVADRQICANIDQAPPPPRALALAATTTTTTPTATTSTTATAGSTAATATRRLRASSPDAHMTRPPRWAQSCGVLEAAKVSQAGYPKRIPFKEFFTYFYGPNALKGYPQNPNKPKLVWSPVADPRARKLVWELAVRVPGEPHSHSEPRAQAEARPSRGPVALTLARAPSRSPPLAPRQVRVLKLHWEGSYAEGSSKEFALGAPPPDARNARRR